VSKYPSPDVPWIFARSYGGAQTPALIVMHSTVTGTKAGAARSVARYFATETQPTSAHYVVDAAEIIQCVPDHNEAWHCGYNKNSIGIEMCDMPVLGNMGHWLVPASQRTGPRPIFHGHAITPLRWIEPSHRAMLSRAAHLTAQLCLAYDIPIRLLSNSELEDWDRKGKHAADGGIVTHQQMSQVFRQSDHWDPGAWPSQLFLKRVTVAAAAIQAASK
jgi:hypothetical protein